MVGIVVATKVVLSAEMSSVEKRVAKETTCLKRVFVIRGSFADCVAVFDDSMRTDW